VLLSLPAAVRGQDAATLSGTVVDTSNAVVPRAAITITDAGRGVVRRTETADTGVFLFDSVPPGEYTLAASKAGFNSLTLEHVQLRVRDRQTVRVQLQVSPAAAASVTVTAEAEGISTDTSTGAAIEHDYSQELPINGRNVEGLIRMSPGVISAAGPDFNVNGLRSNANYYSVDGVSANRPLGGGGFGGGMGRGGGGGMGGGPPMEGGGAGMNGIALDSMQEVRVQTSTFAPEFGRSPGAQISMASRSGSNGLHGSLSEYFRNERMNANDWFANSRADARGEMRQNRFGAVLGGRIVRDRTFFFVSYDGLRLETPQTAIVSVPDLATRKSAPAALRRYLNAFPVPNGASEDDGAAEFHAGFVNPSSSDAWSVRLDHRFNDRWNAFLRFNSSPSGGTSRSSEMMSPNMTSSRNTKSQTATASVVTLLDWHTTNDLRLNYSRSQMSSSSAMDSFGGAVPLTASQVLPAGVSADQGQFSLMVMGLSSYSLGSASRNRQEQYNVVDALTKMVDRHHYKIGADYRRTMPTEYRKPYTASVTFNGLGGNAGSMTSGKATSAVVSANEPAVYPSYVNFSLYAQDSYTATDRTTLTYGLRWDVNPAPGVRKGPRPYALSDMTICAVTQSEGLYHTRWLDVAPRLGLAYQMDPTPGRETVFRIGVGMFYDMGYGMTSGAFSGAPYSSVTNMTSVTFPLSASNLIAPALPPTRPFGQVNAADVALKSPVVYQWSATLERATGRGQMLSLGYVGTAGYQLLVTQSTPSFSSAYDMLMQTANGGASSYHGMQLQYRRRFSDKLQMQLGYTWGHSIDTGSSDMGSMAGFATFDQGNRGDSDYDVRQNLNMSGSLRLPSPRVRLLKNLFGGWHAEWVASARTGLPFNVQGISSDTSDSVSSSSSTPRGSVFAQGRPDYNGQPVWISDPNVAGGRRVNADAFETPDGYQQGNLGRNAIRGFRATQVDLSLRRQVIISESVRLQVAAQAYNALNHPNFASPSGMGEASMSSANFGVATRMLNQGMGGGGGGGVYGNGGPRSVELSLRLEF
jgi:hypothetical protein